MYFNRYRQEDFATCCIDTCEILRQHKTLPRVKMRKKEHMILGLLKALIVSLLVTSIIRNSYNIIEDGGTSSKRDSLVSEDYENSKLLEH